MRQTLSPAPTPARASPAAYRALCVHSRPYVTVSSKSWKYCWSGESAARRRIISVRVEAPLTSSWTIRDSSIVVGGGAARPPPPPPPPPARPTPRPGGATPPAPPPPPLWYAARGPPPRARRPAPPRPAHPPRRAAPAG